jgi:hypothetical protein
MIELATNTRTADNTMGIQSADSGTMISLLGAQRVKCSLRGYFRAERRSSISVKISTGQIERMIEP